MIKIDRYEYQELLPVAKKYRSLLTKVLAQNGISMNYYRLYTEPRAGGLRSKYFAVDLDRFDDIKKWVELFVHTHSVIHSNGIKFEIRYSFVGRSVSLYFRAVGRYYTN